LRARAWSERVHPDDRGRVQAAVEANRRGEATRIRYRALRKQGGYLWLDCSASPVLGEDGRVEYVVWSSRDISDQMAVEANIHESNAQLRAFVEHAPAAVAMFDTNMCYLACSQRWLADYNLESQSIIGKSHYEVFPDIPPRWRSVHRRCLAGAVERRDEDPFRRFDGETQWLRWEVLPWRDLQGRIGGIMMVTEDVTRQRKAEESLREYAERLEQAEDSRFHPMSIGCWAAIRVPAFPATKKC
jgi:PAS domain S-box-containing protein